MLSPFNLAEPLDEILQREGEVFFQKTWDSRGPFAGAGHDRIYKWEGVYWVWEYLGVYQPWDGKCGIIGPYETYKDALRSSEAVCAITEATTELRSELSRREVRRFLGIYLEVPVVQFEWNGEPVRAHRSGRITFVRKNTGQTALSSEHLPKAPMSQAPSGRGFLWSTYFRRIGNDKGGRPRFRADRSSIKPFAAELSEPLLSVARTVLNYWRQ